MCKSIRDDDCTDDVVGSVRSAPCKMWSYYAHTSTLSSYQFVWCVNMNWSVLVYKKAAVIKPVCMCGHTHVMHKCVCVCVLMHGFSSLRVHRMHLHKKASNVCTVFFFNNPRQAGSKEDVIKCCFPFSSLFYVDKLMLGGGSRLVDRLPLSDGNGDDNSPTIKRKTTTMTTTNAASCWQTRT